MNHSTNIDVLIGLEKDMLALYHDLASALPPCIELRHPYSCSMSLTADVRVASRLPAQSPPIPWEDGKDWEQHTAHGGIDPHDGNVHDLHLPSKPSVGADFTQSDDLEDIPLSRRLHAKSLSNAVEDLPLIQRLQARSAGNAGPSMALPQRYSSLSNRGEKNSPGGLKGARSESNTEEARPRKKIMFLQNVGPVPEDRSSGPGRVPQGIHAASDEQNGSIPQSLTSRKPRKPRPPRDKKDPAPAVAPLRPLAQVLLKRRSALKPLGKFASALSASSPLDHPKGVFGPGSVDQSSQQHSTTKTTLETRVCENHSTSRPSRDPGSGPSQDPGSGPSIKPLSNIGSMGSSVIELTEEEVPLTDEAPFPAAAIKEAPAEDAAPRATAKSYFPLQPDRSALSQEVPGPQRVHEAEPCVLDDRDDGENADRGFSTVMRWASVPKGEDLPPHPSHEATASIWGGWGEQPCVNHVDHQSGGSTPESGAGSPSGRSHCSGRGKDEEDGQAEAAQIADGDEDEGKECRREGSEGFDHYDEREEAAVRGWITWNLDWIGRNKPLWRHL